MTDELAVRLQGPQGMQVREQLLQHLQDLQASLLRQLGGGGMGVAWAGGLQATDIKTIQTALSAVHSGIDILQQLKTENL
jgi:hypothetical protein